MARTLTDVDRLEYIKHPYKCPICDSEDITAGEMDFGNNQAWQNITCSRCDAKWTDIYTLTDVEMVE